MKTLESPAPFLVRLAFRLSVAFALAIIWPGPHPRAAAGALCLAMAVACVAAAMRFGEKPSSTTGNRWHEALILVLAGSLLIGFDFWG